MQRTGKSSRLLSKVGILRACSTIALLLYSNILLFSSHHDSDRQVNAVLTETIAHNSFHGLIHAFHLEGAIIRDRH